MKKEQKIKYCYCVGNVLNNHFIDEEPNENNEIFIKSDEFPKYLYIPNQITLEYFQKGIYGWHFCPTKIGWNIFIEDDEGGYYEPLISYFNDIEKTYCKMLNIIDILKKYY